MRAQRALLVAVAALFLACGDKDAFQPDPLLVPWEKLSGRIAYARGNYALPSNPEIVVIDAERRQVYRACKFPQGTMVRDLAWHPSGQSVTATVFVTYPAEWTLVTVDVRSGATTELYPAVGPRFFAAWSRAGRVAFWTFSGLHVDGMPYVPAISGTPLNAPSWSSDGATLAMVLDTPVGSTWWGYGDVNLLDVASGTITPLGPTDASGPAFSQDGGRIAYSRITQAGTEELWVAPVAGGAAVHLSAADSVNPAHPAWSPDGTQIAVEGYTRDFPKRLHLVDSTSGATVQLTADDAEHPSWIP
jgi:hypothetical protein